MFFQFFSYDEFLVFQVFGVEFSNSRWIPGFQEFQWVLPHMVQLFVFEVTLSTCKLSKSQKSYNPLGFWSPFQGATFTIHSKFYWRLILKSVILIFNITLLFVFSPNIEKYCYMTSIYTIEPSDMPRNQNLIVTENDGLRIGCNLRENNSKNSFTLVWLWYSKASEKRYDYQAIEV